MLAGRIIGFSEDVLKSNFMKGLKPEIRAALIPHGPMGIAETMRLAQTVDEKFTPGHRCKDRSLQVLTVCEDREDKSLACEDEEDVEVEEHPHLDVIEVSLNSVVGFTSSHSMKIKGTTGE